MDVLYAASIYPPAVGGAQLHLHCLAQQVQAAGHHVRVATHASRNRDDWIRLSTFAADRDAAYVFEGVPVVQLGATWWNRLRMLPWAVSYYACVPLAARRLGALVGRRFDLVAGQPSLIHVSRMGREFMARAALDFARRQGIPFVLTPNHHPRWHGYRYRAYDEIYRAADAIIALTQAEKDLLVQTKGVSPERVCVTGIGPILSPEYSADQFRSQTGIVGRFVLFLGQQFPYKGVAAVLEAARSVWQRHGDVHFVFIGPQTAYSKRLFSGYNDPRIHNLGCVDLAAKTAALAACEFLCLPSMQESFGGVFVEAWSLGKAVIGGRIPPIACVVDEGRDGLLSSQNPGELAAAMNELLDNPSHAQTLGEAGRQKVAARYAWPQLGRQTIGIYQTLLSQAEEAEPLGQASLCEQPSTVV